jgi:hypothetical protein
MWSVAPVGVYAIVANDDNDDDGEMVDGSQRTTL